MIYYVLAVLAGAAVGCVIAYAFFEGLAAKAKRTARDILEDARKESEKLKKEAEVRAKEDIFGLKEDAEKEIKKARGELRDVERRLSKKEDNVDRKLDLLTKKEKQLEVRESKMGLRRQQVEQQEEELKRLYEEEKQALYRITEMDKEAAEKLLLTRVEQDLEHEKETLVARFVERTKEQSEERAKDIIATAIQRYASAHCQEITVSNIEIEDDTMKGRVIGREGRNIRSFEKVTGVNVIVDDTPGLITISCFDSIRREIARRAMRQLIVDGRIHPTRIEEIVDKTRREIEELVQKDGKQASFDLNIVGLHSRLITCLGRLRFRTSYGQNVLEHSREVAQLAGMIAGELDLNVNLARRCGLLHDIGKALDHEVEGGHPEIGADFARRFDEDAEVVNAIASHHNDVPQTSIYAVITQAADAISGSRPGARGETLERYIKRLEKLESLAVSFPGVKSANAIQAGREVRIVVNSQKISDSKALKLCHEIAREVEHQLTYPGEIKVTLLREMRVVEYAR